MLGNGFKVDLELVDGWHLLHVALFYGYGLYLTEIRLFFLLCIVVNHNVGILLFLFRWWSDFLLFGGFQFHLCFSFLLFIVWSSEVFLLLSWTDVLLLWLSFFWRFSLLLFLFFLLPSLIFRINWRVRDFFLFLFIFSSLLLFIWIVFSFLLFWVVVVFFPFWFFLSHDFHIVIQLWILIGIFHFHQLESPFFFVH